MSGFSDLPSFPADPSFLETLSSESPSTTSLAAVIPPEPTAASLLELDTVDQLPTSDVALAALLPHEAKDPLTAALAIDVPNPHTFLKDDIFLQQLAHERRLANEREAHEHGMAVPSEDAFIEHFAPTTTPISTHRRTASDAQSLAPPPVRRGRRNGPTGRRPSAPMQFGQPNGATPVAANAANAAPAAPVNPALVSPRTGKASRRRELLNNLFNNRFSGANNAKSGSIFPSHLRGSETRRFPEHDAAPHQIHVPRTFRSNRGAFERNRNFRDANSAKNAPFPHHGGHLAAPHNKDRPEAKANQPPKPLSRHILAQRKARSFPESAAASYRKNFVAQRKAAAQARKDFAAGKRQVGKLRAKSSKGKAGNGKVAKRKSVKGKNRSKASKKKNKRALKGKKPAGKKNKRTNGRKGGKKGALKGKKGALKGKKGALKGKSNVKGPKGGLQGKKKVSKKNSQGLVDALGKLAHKGTKKVAANLKKKSNALFNKGEKAAHKGINKAADKLRGKVGNGLMGKLMTKGINHLQGASHKLVDSARKELQGATNKKIAAGKAKVHAGINNAVQHAKNALKNRFGGFFTMAELQAEMAAQSERRPRGNGRAHSAGASKFTSGFNHILERRQDLRAQAQIFKDEEFAATKAEADLDKLKAIVAQREAIIATHNDAKFKSHSNLHTMFGASNGIFDRLPTHPYSGSRGSPAQRSFTPARRILPARLSRLEDMRMQQRRRIYTRGKMGERYHQQLHGENLGMIGGPIEYAESDSFIEHANGVVHDRH